MRRFVALVLGSLSMWAKECNICTLWKADNEMACEVGQDLACHLSLPYVQFFGSVFTLATSRNTELFWYDGCYFLNESRNFYNSVLVN